MAIDWSKLQTYEDWADTLTILLDNARKALTNNDPIGRGAAKRDLIKFIDESPNWLIKNLDDVAYEAIKDLGKADINEAITSIDSRTVEIIRLTKSVKSITEEAEAAGSALRLEKAKEVVDSSTNVVNAIKDLRSELESNGKDKRIDSLASAAIKSIQDLRAAIELS
jgi:hypothetical protein